MRKYFLLIIVLLTCVELTISDQIMPVIRGNSMYQKVYRELVMKKNRELINDFNSDESNTFTISPNKFLSLSNQQFLSIYTSGIKKESPMPQVTIQSKSQSSKKGSSQTTISNTSTASNSSSQVNITVEVPFDFNISVDLTNYASPVRDQGTCNSCYAHSSISIVQTIFRTDLNVSLDLSQQQIVDCTLNWAPIKYSYYNNLGCDGGWGWKALAYINNLGVTQQVNYPYLSMKTSKVGQCTQSKIQGKRFKIQSYSKKYEPIWPQTQCHILIQALSQKISVAVSIWVPSGPEFQFYGSGSGISIFDKCGPYKNLNHQLQLVGTTNQYWKLRNSYGTGWGQNGYLFLDKNKGLNCLNVCMDFAFPTGVVLA